MPPPDRMLTTLRRAIDLVAATPGRSGHLVCPPDCGEVLVAGDLHGHVPNFQTILKAADLANHPRRHLVLQELIHSEFRYPNGGDKSHQLVDLFAALKCQYPDRVHFLPGNHEMAQWAGRPVGRGDEMYNARFLDGVAAAYGGVPGRAIYQAYMDLFRACPLALRTPNAVFVSHSITPGRSLPLFDADRLHDETYPDAAFERGGFVYGLLWGRDVTEETAEAFLRKVDADLLVTGHIATDEGFLVPNRRQVIVDSAASPASYVLFPADRPITHAELVAGMVVF